MNIKMKWMMAILLFFAASQLYIHKAQAAAPLVIESLQLDKSPVNLEDDLTISIKLSGTAKQIQLCYVPKGLPRGTTYYFYLGPTDENGHASKTITVPVEMKSGTWALDSVNIDSNQVIYSDPDTFDLSSGNITISTTPKLIFKSLTVDKNQARTGEQFMLTMKSEDGVGHYDLPNKVVYRQPSGAEYTVSFTPGGYISQRTELGYLPVGLTTEPGVWKVDRVIVDDPVNQNTQTFYNKAFYNVDGAMDFSDLDLQVNRIQGWVYNYNGNRYYLDPVTGAVKTGLFVDSYNGYTYFFHEDGRMAYNEWIQIDGKSYYFAKWGADQGMEGTMAKDGWTYVPVSDTQYDLYYFYSDGTHITGTGWKNMNGQWYYFLNDVAQSGWVTDAGKKYYLKDYVMVAGLQQIDGKYDYFNKDGSFNVEFKVGWNTAEGKSYYLLNDGKLFNSGWKQIWTSWYYFYDNGQMAANSWVQTGTKWYYLNANGTMKTSSWLAYKNKWYYLDAAGAMKTGWLSSGGAWYYLDSSGAMSTGWKYIGRNWYYFYSSGKMATGHITINRKYYYFNGEGVLIN